MSQFKVALKLATPWKQQIALLARQSAAVLVRKEVRMCGSEVVNEAAQSSKLATAAIAGLLARALMQLSLVNLQRYRTPKHLATFVTAVLNASDMNCRDMIFQKCLIVKCS